MSPEDSEPETWVSRLSSGEEELELDVEEELVEFSAFSSFCKLSISLFASATLLEARSFKRFARSFDSALTEVLAVSVLEEAVVVDEAVVVEAVDAACEAAFERLFKVLSLRLDRSRERDMVLLSKQDSHVIGGLRRDLSVVGKIFSRSMPSLVSPGCFLLARRTLRESTQSR